MNDSKQPLPLDYAGPRPQQHGLWITATLLVVVFTGLLAAATSLIFAFVVPHFAAVFRDFKTELPGITKLLLTLAHSRLWLLVWLLPLVVGGLTYLMTARQPERAIRVGRVLIVLALGLFLLLFLAAFIVVGLVAPMLSLMQQVAGGR